MKTLNLQRSSQTSLLQQWLSQLGGTISVIDNESTLKIDNEIAKGTICQFILKSGISYFNYDITFHEDIIVKHVSQYSMTYDFIYSSESNLNHNFGVEEKIRQIGKFRTAIFCSEKGLDSVLHFVKNQTYILSTISVSSVDDRNREEVDDIFVQKLQSIFNLSETEGSIAYIGSFNLKIADQIQQLNETPQNGIVRSLLMEAIIKTILALELQQHSEDLENMDSKCGSLTKKELAIIQKLSNFIKKYPEKEYTISSLCVQSGLSKSKLQEGFRLMHDLTVTQYILHTRILAAEHLIKTTDLNISEIVYSIGLTSRSYFSKIFKKKFNCSPKTYQENQQLTSMSV